MPNSLIQISKITWLKESSDSLVRVSKAMTVGFLRGHRSESRREDLRETNSTFLNKVMDGLFSSATGFVSLIVGSFVRNIVLGFYSNVLPVDVSSVNTQASAPHTETNSLTISTWVNVFCDEKCRKSISDCIQIFVNNAVSVYLDRTTDINAYDELFAGLTNPKRQMEVRDILVSIVMVLLKHS